MNLKRRPCFHRNAFVLTTSIIMLSLDLSNEFYKFFIFKL
ncbi:hypothetical protein BRYFOR_05927 [Marvinbryantia formatexigens DSM 14469]|uniref:Uncharacterized protein n=1 Tax=Marvinbryantia formatexigens DSM 14469 TaxID=478749 RepID=C6LBD2_9FIRM|nr:hypothetical protein BRYFOR_05927 [Marvinbryantia formatexigens DSM 14469]